MRRAIIITVVIFLISLTSTIKNSSKNLENEIYNLNESIFLLDRKYNLTLLENNYLSSPKKLFESISISEKKQYSPIDILNLRKVNFSKDKFDSDQFIKYEWYWKKINY